MSRNNHTERHIKKDNLAKYSVLFYESFAEVLQQKESIIHKCSGCDQLNIVIRAEGDMDHTEILAFNPKVKLFAGAAWYLIHKRREEDGWYDQLNYQNKGT